MYYSCQFVKDSITARQILGFNPTETLSHKKIKARRRKLQVQFHPDAQQRNTKKTHSNEDDTLFQACQNNFNKFVQKYPHSRPSLFQCVTESAICLSRQLLSPLEPVAPLNTDLNPHSGLRSYLALAQNSHNATPCIDKLLDILDKIGQANANQQYPGYKLLINQLHELFKKRLLIPSKFEKVLQAEIRFFATLTPADFLTRIYLLVLKTSTAKTVVKSFIAEQASYQQMLFGDPGEQLGYLPVIEINPLIQAVRIATQVMLANIRVKMHQHFRRYLQSSSAGIENCCPEQSKPGASCGRSWRHYSTKQAKLEQAFSQLEQECQKRFYAQIRQTIVTKDSSAFGEIDVQRVVKSAYYDTMQKYTHDKTIQQPRSYTSFYLKALAGLAISALTLFLINLWPDYRNRFYNTRTSYFFKKYASEIPIASLSQSTICPSP